MAFDADVAKMRKSAAQKITRRHSPDHDVVRCDAHQPVARTLGAHIDHGPAASFESRGFDARRHLHDERIHIEGFQPAGLLQPGVTEPQEHRIRMRGHRPCDSPQNSLAMRVLEIQHRGNRDGARGGA